VARLMGGDCVRGRWGGAYVVHTDPLRPGERRNEAFKQGHAFGNESESL
jgi:hypothetical protein